MPYSLIMQKQDNIFVLQFPEAKNIIVSGDIHGDFNLLVNKLCVQYEMKDTVLIVAGDCGFGFEQKGYYENIVRRNSKRMNDANNWIVFVRGNHDNPAYYDGKVFNHKRFVAVPDYSVLQACGHTILCIGGAISIDRQYRKDSWMRQQSIQHKHQSNEPLDRNVYWDEHDIKGNTDPRFALKLTPDRNEELREHYSAVTPAWHWNKKHWSDVYYERLDEQLVTTWIKESYDLVVSKLSKTIRQKYI